MAFTTSDETANPLLEEVDCKTELSHGSSLDLMAVRRPSSFTISSVKLTVAFVLMNVSWLFLVIVALKNPSHHQPECGLATDTLFGNIPWKTVTLESEERFITSDPGHIDGDNSSEIWKEIYPSAWVAVSDPASVGFGGGAKLFENAQDGSLWDTKTEGFGVAVMHQLHCVALIKRSFIEYRKAGATQNTEEHVDHCVEYLRQAVMCHGDLTLERPETQSYPHRTTGWGNAHKCRDWRRLIAAVKTRAIERGSRGWQSVL